LLRLTLVAPEARHALRNTDMSQLSQVQSAREGAGGKTAEQVLEAVDIEGHKVLTASAPVAPLSWFVFVETPVEEAYAPLYAAIERTGLVLLGALALAFAAGLFLARRMIVPIRNCARVRHASAPATWANASQSSPATRLRRWPSGAEFPGFGLLLTRDGE
jgi:hypothetical protein